MLSIAAMASGQENYYVLLAREDYFTQGGEPPGYWLGRGAVALRLTGAVEAHELRDLFLGRSPCGSCSLVQHQAYSNGRSRQPGWDLTFNAPKDVSLLWALGGSALSKAIQRAQERAVRAAIDYLEQEAAFTRRGRGGARSEPVGIVCAAFEHGTSRAQDPHLHTHVLLLNAGLRADGSWGTVRSSDFYQHKMAAGALYRIELASELIKLGVGLLPGEVAFEVKGVAEESRALFSKRRQQIEAAMADLGVSGARAAGFIAKFTRQRKGHASREELRDLWSDLAASNGLKRQLAGSVRPDPVPLSPARSEAVVSAALRQGLRELTARTSFFTERDLLRYATPLIEHHGIESAEVRSSARRFLTTFQEIADLGVIDDYQHYTTRELLAVEGEVLALAGCLASQSRDALALDREAAQEEKSSAECLVAGSLQCLVGAKEATTETLSAVRDHSTRHGLNVVGLSPTALGAAALQNQTSIESYSVAAALFRLDPTPRARIRHLERQMLLAAKGWRPSPPPWLKLSKKSVLVVDQAQSLGTRDLHTILRHAEAKGARVILSGDPHAITSLSAGSPFRVLCRRLGSTQVSPNSSSVRREWMLEASEQVARGELREALSEYASRGFLKISENHAASQSDLIVTWNERRTADLSKTAIICATKEQRSRMNELAQNRRVFRKELSSKRVRLSESFLYEGDRVLLTRSNTALAAKAGDLGTVVRIESRGLLAPIGYIRLDRRVSHFDLPERVRDDEKLENLRHTHSSHVVPIILDKDAPLELGYAFSVHEVQGITFERVYSLMDASRQDRELTYVQASSASEETYLFAATGGVCEDLEELAAIANRTNQQELALEIIQRS